MAQTLHNNVFTKLAVSLSNSATSISLLDGSGFPTPAVGDFYFATLVSISGSTGKEDDWEIVKVTGKPATNTLTVTRGQEGTAARAWDAYTPCEIRITAGTVIMPDGTQNLSNKTITSSTLDSTVVGGTTAAAGSFTDLDATTVDATNVEVTNLKAKDGTAAGSIADSTGVVTVASAVLTTADINGGTVDGATIGQTTAALGTFTDMVADELQLTGGSGDQGTLSWNTNEDTVALVVSSGESLQLGQEVEYNVRNNSGSSIAKGVPVMITGTLGSSGRITIDEMDATSVANDKKYLGITAEAIASGADGKVMYFGKVSGLNTSSYSAGDLLFLDTSSVGALTATEPSSGIKLGAAYVVHSHASAGVLMVRPSASVGLHDLHDVFVDSPGTGEIIRYNASNGLWETKTLAEAGIATTTNFTSTGIDDNATSTAITIDSSQNTTFAGTINSGDITISEGTPVLRIQDSDGTNQYTQINNLNGTCYFGARNDTADGGIIVGGYGGNSFTEFARWSNSGHLTQKNNLIVQGAFTSLGIDDNATTTAITIDSSENVLIGRTDATLGGGGGDDLQIGSGAGNAGLTIHSSTTNNGDIQFADGTVGDSSYRGLIRYKHNDDNLELWTAGTRRVILDSSGDISIGSASNHAGARVVINDTPPTAFGSPMLQVGQETFTASGYYSIGLGYTAGSYTEPPAEIAAVATSSSGGTTADIIFGTRSVTTNTAVTERMRINSSGNVGIGVTDPSYGKLIVNAGGSPHATYGVANFNGGTSADSFVSVSRGASNQGGIKIMRGAVTDFSVYVNAAESSIISYNGGDTGDGLFFQSGSAATNVMAINSSGNVGIGTSSPSELLDVGDHTAVGNRSIRISQRTATSGLTYGGLEFYMDNTAGTEGVNAAIKYATGSVRNHGELTFHTGNAASTGERVRIDHNGNVGIGTTSPARILHVENDGLADLLLRDTSSYSAGTGPAVIFQGKDSGGTTTQFGAIYGVSNGSNSGQLTFETRNSGSSAERMRINPDGRIVVTAASTVSPNMEINRTALSSGEGVLLNLECNNNSGTGNILRFTNDDPTIVSGNYVGEIQFVSDDPGAPNSGLVAGFQVVSEDSAGNSAFTWRTGGSERMRIDSSGNVGIGATSPSAVISSSRILEVASSGNTTLSVTSTDSVNDRSAILELLASGNGGSKSIILYGDTDTTPSSPSPLVWQSYHSGARTERMRIDSSGDVQIHGTSMLASSILSVDGSGENRNGVASKVSNNAYYAYVGINSNGVNRFVVYGDGDVENTNNSYGALSDERLKSNIVDASSQVDDIMAVQVRSYTLNETGDTHIGVVAQELEASGMSGLVKTDEEGMKSVKYSILYMKAIKALQEAVTRIETLEAEVAALKGA